MKIIFLFLSILLISCERDFVNYEDWKPPCVEIDSIWQYHYVVSGKDTILIDSILISVDTIYHN